MTPQPRILKRTELVRSRNFRLVRTVLDMKGYPRMTRDTLEHPGAVAIVPILDGRRVMLIHQYRFACRGLLWEIPAGTLEPPEAPRVCAQRELMEEIGYRARRIEKLATFYTAPGFCTELMHLYLARGLTPASARGDADEIIRPVAVPFREALRMIDRGTIRDAKTIVGLHLAAQRLRLG